MNVFVMFLLKDRGCMFCSGSSRVSRWEQTVWVGPVWCLGTFQMLLAPRIQGMAAMVKQKDTKRLIAKVAMITLYIIK